MVRRGWRLDGWSMIKKKPYVLCIQESKMAVIDDLLIKSIWGDTPYGYSYQPSVGASGGLLTVWDTSLVDVCSSMSIDNVLVIKGKVIQTTEEFVIGNVYAPCDSVSKRALWERLSPIIENHEDMCLCLCGDFNSVRNIEERKGRETDFRRADEDVFNTFIVDNSLIDLPICGRLFTWYRSDSMSMSRLDRFLLSAKWCATWSNSIQVAYQRGLSDHVPLMLYVDEVNWGPRPLRMLKC